MANLINVERATVGYGTRTLLDAVSLGVDEGDAIGVVGRNGDGKTTLLQVLTGTREPDSGRVTHTSGLSVGYLRQADDFAWVPPSARSSSAAGPTTSGRPNPTRAPSSSICWPGSIWTPTSPTLSGGERRRVALAEVLLAGHDVLVLDEPTNHLDVEVIGWLAEPPVRAAVQGAGGGQPRPLVPRRGVHTDVGGARRRPSTPTTAATPRTCWRAPSGCGWPPARRRGGRNLMRKELAWLRRGPPARTSKPKFRIQAANELIANEPPPRDSLVLQRFATTRLGKDVFDLHRVRLEVGDRVILDRVDWSIGPGARIGLVGVNGTGKTSVLRLLTGELPPAAGTIKRGTTLQIGYLSQALAELTAPTA